MKKMNKKGFTIVELVIVIAVIAILSAVMIPTFSGMTKKAKESAALQEANHAKSAVLAEENGQFNADAVYYFFNGDYVFKMNENGVLEKTTVAEDAEASENDIVYAVSATQDAITLGKKTIEGDNPETTDVVETEYQVDLEETILEDLGKTVVWVDVA